MLSLSLGVVPSQPAAAMPNDRKAAGGVSHRKGTAAAEHTKMSGMQNMLGNPDSLGPWNFQQEVINHLQSTAFTPLRPCWIRLGGKRSSSKSNLVFRTKTKASVSSLGLLILLP